MMRQGEHYFFIGDLMLMRNTVRTYEVSQGPGPQRSHAHELRLKLETILSEKGVNIYG